MDRNSNTIEIDAKCLTLIVSGKLVYVKGQFAKILGKCKIYDVVEINPRAAIIFYTFFISMEIRDTWRLLISVVEPVGDRPQILQSNKTNSTSCR